MILSYSSPSGSLKHIKLKTISSLPPVTIGRSSDASIKIDDNSCSRVHCAIRYWDDVFVVRDMNSRNGTLLNGKKIKVAILEPGDTLKVGAIEFYVAAEEGSGTDVTIMKSVEEED